MYVRLSLFGRGKLSGRKQVAAANVQTPVVSDTSQKQLASAGSKLTMVPGSVAVLKKPSK